MQVRAVAVGFDGLNVRVQGDLFEMPGDPFKQHEDNHRKRQELHKLAVKNWNGASPLPADPGPISGPLWFEKVGGGTVEDASDLT